MSASEVVLWASLAALNLALAALVAATRPRRTVHGLVVVLFVSNAILAALRVAHEAGVPPDGGLATRLDLAASAPSIAVLAVLPWLLTQRGPSAGRTRALLGLAAALVLANWTILAAWADADVSALHSVVTQAPLLLGVALGGLVLLDAYLAAPSHARRGEAMLFLAAYELKASTSVAWFLPGALGGAEFGGIPGVPLLPWVALLLVPALAAPISLLLSRLRGHAGAPRPLAGDALVLGFLLLGLGLPYAGSALDLEYLLARPLLFAAGILSYGLLDIELRARRGLVAATIFAGMGAVLVVASQVLEEAGAGLVVAVTVGVITALGVGAVLA